MGLISSVQTLLHYSSLHQVCSYSYPGFKEFPPIHAVLNIFLSVFVVHQDGTSYRRFFSFLEATIFYSTKQKICSQAHPSPTPATKGPLPQKTLWTRRELSPFPPPLYCYLVFPLHYVISSSSCLFFALAKKRK